MNCLEKYLTTDGLAFQNDKDTQETLLVEGVDMKSSANKSLLNCFEGELTPEEALAGIQGEAIAGWNLFDLP